MNTNLATNKTTLESVLETACTRQTSIHDLNRQIEDKDKTLAAAGVTLEERQSTISGLKADLGDKQVDLDNALTTSSNHESTISKLRGRLGTHDRASSNTQATITSLESTVSHLCGQLKLIQSEKSTALNESRTSQRLADDLQWKVEGLTNRNQQLIEQEKHDSAQLQKQMQEYNADALEDVKQYRQQIDEEMKIALNRKLEAGRDEQDRTTDAYLDGLSSHFATLLNVHDPVEATPELVERCIKTLISRYNELEMKSQTLEGTLRDVRERHNGLVHTSKDLRSELKATKANADLVLGLRNQVQHLQPAAN